MAAQDGRLAPHDRILAINGADVRYARLDHASKLIQQCRHHVSLVLAKGTGGHAEVDGGGSSSEYQHLFQRPDPALPVYHSRTKSAPERLVPRPRPYAQHLKDSSNDKSLDDITNSLEDIVGSPEPNALSASCESLDERNISAPLNESSNILDSNASLLSAPGPFSGSLGSLNEPFQNSSRSLGGSLGSPLNQSAGSLRGELAGTHVTEDAPALPPRSRLGLNRSSDALQDDLDASLLLTGEPPLLDNSGLSAGSNPPLDGVDGSCGSRLRGGRRSRDGGAGELADVIHGFRRSLRIDSNQQLHQKSVIISKVG